MMYRQRFLSAPRFICGAALLALIYYGTPALGEQSARFTLTTVDGRREPIDELLKKGPVLIAFWASWCKSCKEELQALDKLVSDDVRARATLVAVTIDTPRSIMQVKSYIAARKMKYLFCTDPNSELLKQFGGNAIPFIVILGPDRKVMTRHIGYAPGDERRLLNLLLTGHETDPSDGTGRSGKNR